MCRASSTHREFHPKSAFQMWTSDPGVSNVWHISLAFGKLSTNCSIKSWTAFFPYVRRILWSSWSDSLSYLEYRQGSILATLHLMQEYQRNQEKTLSEGNWKKKWTSTLSQESTSVLQDIFIITTSCHPSIWTSQHHMREIHFFTCLSGHQNN